MRSYQIKTIIEDVLKQDDTLWQEGEFDDSLFIDKVTKLNKDLLNLLFRNDVVRAKFFSKVNNKAWVFDKDALLLFWQENQVFNSYTNFLNRTGLSLKNNSKFIYDNSDVVLNFPFKDCILRGGQTKEEARGDEVFYNEVIAQDEIDRLLEPKALHNFETINKNGTHSLLNPPPPVADTLIHGNNLFALHSIKEVYANKIKFIYIDPPYNNKSDDFNYNNKFKRSTWLTFMKSRLQIAKELLTDDGSIFISIDENERDYIKVLGDEIFHGFGFMDFCWIATKANLSQFGKHDKIPTLGANLRNIKKSHEYVLCYYKDRFNFNLIENKKKTIDSRTTKAGNNEQVVVFPSGLKNEKPITKTFYNTVGGQKELIKILNPEGMIFKNGVLKNSVKLQSCFSIPWQLKRFFENQTVTDKRGQKIIEVYFKNSGIPQIKKESKGSIVDSVLSGYGDTSFAKSELDKLMGRETIKYIKPYQLMQHLLQIATDKNNTDYVLDFFAGSGTTGHAVLKQNKEDGGNRKFILIEQLSEHIDICKERLQRVLKVENIDQSVLYFELAKFNQLAKEKIKSCKTHTELGGLFEELYDKYFLHYQLNVQQFKKSIKQPEFKSLSLSEQKQVFLSILDINQLYVSRVEMADSKYNISQSDQELTNQFYNQNETGLI